MNANFPFTAEQKEYLSGFFAGTSQRGLVGPVAAPQPVASESAPMVFGTPVEDLCKEERIKLELNGLDCYERIRESADTDTLPDGGDLFRFKYYGLFNVSPAQESLMLRCRIPGGALLAHQLEGLADMAESWAGGYAHITTRANIQLREIAPRHAVKVLEKLVDLGLTSRGSGADNLRNVTATPTAGFDPQELCDVLPLAREMHHLILNTREFYGLPRKFNIAFDGGGAVSACADTNDIAFYAVEVGEGEAVEAGVWFRVQLAGITGHKQFATDCGVLIRPEQCVPVAAAMIRVFIENGDRTNRGKARLKYLIDRWGSERFLQETEKKLGYALPRVDLNACQQRGPARPHGHLGIHAQAQPGYCYLGARVPVGKLLPEQMRALAQLSRRFGRGELRLTVWQNFLLPFARNEEANEAAAALAAVGFSCEPDPLRGGIVACTGSFGCKYAAAATKTHAVELGDYLAERFAFDAPINIHLTGCPHSCAQHYVGDIGLQAVKVKTEQGIVEGYHIVLGGGVDDRQAIGKEVFKSVPYDDVKPLLAQVLQTYLEKREEGERFSDFNRRHDAAALRALYSEGVEVR